ncbi:MAG: glycosyltransferase family 2 protein [bacterium]
MSDTNIKLSIAIASYNEAENIQPCLESVKDLADEIVVVDGTSTDKTAELAREMGAAVIVVPNQKNFHINKTLAIDNCHGEWILQLDADERVSTALAQEIKTIISSPNSVSYAAFYLKRRNYFLGRWMNKGGMYPDPVIRLFQKGRAHLPEKTVHELMVVDGETSWLDNDLLHIADPTFSRYLKRSNRYTTLQAEEWLKDGKIGLGWPTIILYCFGKPIYRFFEIYLRHKGLLDGFPGFVFALYSGLHITSSYVKYYEKRKSGKGITLSTDWE